MNRKVARRYAQALFELVESNHRQVARRLEDLVELLGRSPELREVLQSPAFLLEERRRVVDKLLERLGWSKPLDRFLWVVVENHRVALLGDILQVFTAMVDEMEGKVRARVESARAIADEQKDRLTGALSRALGREVIIEHELQPRLLAGLRVRVGDLLVDGSLRMQLDKMRDQLTRTPT